MDARHAIEVLLRLTRTLTRDGALEDLLQDVTDATLEIVGGDHASIRLVDESGAEFLSGARSGRGTGHSPVKLSPREGLLGWVREEQRAAYIPDTANDPRFVVKDGQGFSIGSIVSVPMWSGESVVGVLSVSARPTCAFPDDVVEYLQLLSNCASPAISRARLRRLTITDTHTRAFNQGYLFPRLEQEIERTALHGEPLSVVAMDLDHFKHVNDSWGHPTGDVVLRIFADRVREVVRRNDVFIRRGGEEFVLIMPGLGGEHAQQSAERVRRNVESPPFPLEDDPGQLAQTVSLGVATWNGRESARELESRADKALYQAKSEGRNCTVVAQ